MIIPSELFLKISPHFYYISNSISLINIFLSGFFSIYIYFFVLEEKYERELFEYGSFSWVITFSRATEHSIYRVRFWSHGVVNFEQITPRKPILEILLGLCFSRSILFTHSLPQPYLRTCCVVDIFGVAMYLPSQAEKIVLKFGLAKTSCSLQNRRRKFD